MKLPEPAIIGELMCVGATIILCGVGIAVGSSYAGSMLDAIYNETFPYDFVTRIAKKGVIWAPALYGILLFSVVTFRIRFQDSRWITWVALCIAALAAAFTLYGVVKPFASTTFGLGSQ